MSYNAHLCEPEPEWVPILAKLRTQPREDWPTDIPAARQEELEESKKTLEKADYPKVGLVVTEKKVPVKGGEITVRTYTPEPKDGEPQGGTYPVMLWIHGGGWCFGNMDFYDIHCREICLNHRLAVANVDYRLAPVHPFPYAVDDCYEALKFCITRAKEFGGDASKGLLVAGLSAGGNLAAVVALRARDDSAFPGKVTGQLLQVPGLCRPSEYPERLKFMMTSFEQNKDSVMLDCETVLVCDKTYNAPPFHVEFSPLLAPSHANLPPAYIQVTGSDPLRDDGLAYAYVLSECGIPVKTEVYKGFPHGFNIRYPELEASKRWKRDMDEGIRWLLSFH